MTVFLSLRKVVYHLFLLIITCILFNQVDNLEGMCVKQTIAMIGQFGHVA